MKRKKTSRFNSFVMIMLIISFLFGFCGVGQLFGDKNEIPQTEEVSTLTGNPAKDIPEKEPVIDSGNYTVKTWDDYLIEKYARGEEIDLPLVNGKYQISTAEQLAFVSYLSNNGGIYPFTQVPGALDENIRDLPEGYVQLEYLESYGTQHVNTGIAVNNSLTTNLSFEFEIEFKSITGRTLIGYSGSSMGYWGINNGVFELGGKKTSVTAELNKIYKIKHFRVSGTNEWVLSIDGEEFKCTDKSNGNYNLHSLNGSYITSSKIYSIKVFEDGELLRDFVPCYQDSTKTSMLYDFVSGNYFKNSGSGYFNVTKTLSISDKTFELTNDIYLNDGKLGLNETTDESGKVTYTPSYEDGGNGVLYQWTPIWKNEIGYGLPISILGKGYKVYGMYVNETTEKAGLFGHIGHWAGVVPTDDFHLRNSLVYSTANCVGGFVGTTHMGVSFKNSSFDGYVIGANYVGGFGGKQRDFAPGFNNCINYGTVIATGNYASGMMQNFYPHAGGIKDCVNYGTIIAGNYASGISSAGMTMANCVNYGKIYSKGTAYGIGNSSSTNCTNYGDVTGSWVCGISDSAATNCTNYGTIRGSGLETNGISHYGATNCVNYGNVYGANVASGITMRGDVINSKNYARVEGRTSAGGLLVTNSSNYTATLRNSANYGEIISTEGNAGGISSRGWGNLTVYDCKNYGYVQGKTSAGGLFSGVNGTLQIRNCGNYADVKSLTSNAGGIVDLVSGGTLKIIRCNNLGKITAKTTSTTTYAGGLVGSIAAGTTTIESCTNEGKVSGKTATGFVGQATGSCTIKNSLNNGDITSSTYEGATLSSTFGVNNASQLTNCITSSKINGEKVNACAYVKDGYFSEQYRTGKIISSNSSHTAMFQGVIDADYIKENNFTDFTPSPDDFKKEYTKLEYIQSNGSQYIVVPFLPQLNDTLQWEVDNLNSTMQTLDSRSFYGLWHNNKTTIGFQLGAAKIGDVTQLRLYYGETWEDAIKDMPVQDIEKGTYVIKLGNGIQSLDGKVVSTKTISSLNYDSWSLNNGYIIFGGGLLSWDSVKPTLNPGRIRNMIWYRNSAIVHNFIPVKRNNDGVVGLYDIVESKFYADANGGNFEAGPKASLVPAGYTELESIKSNGSQYIDTGYVTNNKTKIEMKFHLLSASGDQKLMGSYGSGGICLGVLNDKWRLGAATWQDNSITATTNETTLSIEGNTWNINGVTKTTGAISGSNGSLLLFGVRHNGKLLEKAKIKVISFKISEGGTVIRDFIPARRNSDGMIGLYDTVEKKFYTDANGGKFEVGD